MEIVSDERRSTSTAFLLWLACALDGEDALRMKLLEAAAKRNGQLSVTEGVIAAGKPFAVVEPVLDAMAKSGYVGITNRAETGVVVYTSGELSK